eukprot:scaffold7460_cov64-Cyclotella_meneghiniana.AAC.14
MTKQHQRKINSVAVVGFVDFHRRARKNDIFGAVANEYHTHGTAGRNIQSNSSTKTTTVCCDFHTMSTSSYFLYSLAKKDIIQINTASK